MDIHTQCIFRIFYLTSINLLFFSLPIKPNCFFVESTSRDMYISICKLIQNINLSFLQIGTYYQRSQHHIILILVVFIICPRYNNHKLTTPPNPPPPTHPPCNVQAPGDTEQTASRHYEHHRRVECARLLLSWRGPLVTSATGDDTNDGVVEVPERVDLAAVDSHRNTPLHYAARSGTRRFVEVRCNGFERVVSHH